MTTRNRRIAIIGAGPVGLEAALAAVELGFDVQVFERGTVAKNVCEWGHVRLFSPFGLTSSQRGRRAIAEQSANGSCLPDDDALLTGRELVEHYLIPLSQLPQLAHRIHQNVTVTAIGRSRTWKGDLIGRPERADDPFQLLLANADGERVAQADIIFDCSGTYGNHNWIGAGGVACIGEQSAAGKIEYRLPDILGANRDRYAGKKTLVAGSGYSAATAVVALAELSRTEAKTSVIWLTRSDRNPPMARIPEDALPERDRLAKRANELAVSPNSRVAWRRGCLIRRVVYRELTDNFLVGIESGNGSNRGLQQEELVVDRVIANVGYRPDRKLYEELQVHECYASQGPIKLAAALLGETSADCLSQSSHGSETLSNPEPGMFILGAKSYGRDSRFLIKIGIEQVEDVLALIAQ